VGWAGLPGDGLVSARLPPALIADDLRFVWEQVHDRYCRQTAGRPVTRVTFRDLDDDRRRALAGLLGLRRLRGERATISVRRLDDLLLASDAALTARQVAEAVCGPVVNRAERARDALRAAGEGWGRLRETAGPRLEGWIEQLRRSGMATRAARAAGTGVEVLVGAALSVVGRLPAEGVALSALAEEVAGDPHALDRDRPLRTLVLSAALWLRGLHGESPPAGAAAQRALLDEVGVVCDTVSSSSLVLNLTAVGSGYLDRQLAAGREAGEPVRVTLRSLTLHGVSFEPGDGPIHVCENPLVLQVAADRFGPHAAPLVCTEGWPTTPTLRLLEAARTSGRHLLFSADFDMAGLRIGNFLLGRLGALPWRMSASDYENHTARRPFGVELQGEMPNARWDDQLAAAMRRRRRAVFEEQRLEDLLNDLGGAELNSRS
jgi:uncharacterized protein (TIGR02679 family)